MTKYKLLKDTPWVKAGLTTTKIVTSMNGDRCAHFETSKYQFAIEVDNKEWVGVVEEPKWTDSDMTNFAIYYLGDTYHRNAKDSFEDWKKLNKK